MRLLERALWLGLLAIVALRPWILDLVLPERFIVVQWVGLIIGLAWWVSKRGWRQGLHPHLLLPCLLLLLAYFLSTLLSQNRLEAFLEGQALGLGVLLCAAVALANQRQRQQLLMVLVVTGTVLALRALWQAAVLFPALEHFAWTRLTSQAHVADFATEVIARRRVFGPFPLPGLMAAALMLLLPISVAVLRPWATTSTRRIITIGVCGVQITALLLTQSLGGIGSLCAATLLVMALRHSPWRQQIVMCCITVVSLWLLLTIRPELRMLEHPRNPLVQRLRYWHSTVEMIRDHPIRGIGAGNYAFVYPSYQRPEATETRFAHNVWLQTWVTWGIVGLIGLVGLFIGSIRFVVRQPLGFQIALWAFWMLASIDITWSIFQVTCLWWPFLGLLSPTTRHQGDAKPAG